MSRKRSICEAQRLGRAELFDACRARSYRDRACETSESRDGGGQTEVLCGVGRLEMPSLGLHRQNVSFLHPTPRREKISLRMRISHDLASYDTLSGQPDIARLRPCFVPDDTLRQHTRDALQALWYVLTRAARLAVVPWHDHTSSE